MNDPEIEACLRQIAEARERLKAALAQARAGRPASFLAWRGWFQRHPVECALGAAALGFILAGPAPSCSSGEGATLLDDLSRAGLESALVLALKSLI